MQPKSTRRICDLFNFILLLDTLCRLFEIYFCVGEITTSSRCAPAVCRWMAYTWHTALLVPCCFSFLCLTQNFGSLSIHICGARDAYYRWNNSQFRRETVARCHGKRCSEAKLKTLHFYKFVESINHESRIVYICICLRIYSGRPQRTRIKIKLDKSEAGAERMVILNKMCVK